MKLFVLMYSCVSIKKYYVHSILNKVKFVRTLKSLIIYFGFYAWYLLLLIQYPGVTTFRYDLTLGGLWVFVKPIYLSYWMYYIHINITNLLNINIQNIIPLHGL